MSAPGESRGATARIEGRFHPGAGTLVTITIGPVGLPVGEPPGGSTLTATFSAESSARRCGSLNVRSARYAGREAFPVKI